VTGASGAGKSTMRTLLTPLYPEWLVLDLDPWIATYDGPDLHAEVLRVAAASGKPVILCGAAIPENIEPKAERSLFSAVHYLALVCEDAELEPRLRARPGWATWGDKEYLSYHWNFNTWLKTHAALTNPPMTLLRTTGASPEETLRSVLAWLKSLPA